MAKRPSASSAPPIDAKDGDSVLDRAVLEAFASQFASSRASTAVDQAQDMMFDAMEEPDRRKRVALAHKALLVSADCADAWLMLARETAVTPEDSVNFHAKAVAAGERALGKAAFRDDVGMFWGLIETRPYMRARQGLAMAQWEVGRHDEAVAGFQDMLRLNPGDNQGVRYVLLDWLLRLGRDADAAKLMKRYNDDDSAEWLWSAVLVAFRKSGPSAAARTALGQATAANRFVASYLTGRKKVRRSLSAYIAVGSDEEGAYLAQSTHPTWAAQAGALDWLAGETPALSVGRKPSAKSAK